MFENFLLAEFHWSRKTWLLIYKYKKKQIKIPSESEEIINFWLTCVKWGWGYFFLLMLLFETWLF